MHGSRYIQILGSGAGDANFGTPDAAELPAKDRRRYCSNYLTPDLLIDFNHQTPGAMAEYGIDPGSIRHLLISHGHFDHFQPLEIIRFAASLPHPLVVYGNGMVTEALELCRKVVFDEASGRYAPRPGPFNVAPIRLTLGQPVAVGGVQVTALHGNHSMNKRYNIMEEQALNFLVEVGDRTLFYGLDSSYMMPETSARLAGTRLDMAILDATFGNREIDPLTSGHHNWAMLADTLSELRAAGCIDADTVLVADHLSCGNIGPHDPMAAEQAARGITVAYDGLTLEI